MEDISNLMVDKPGSSFFVMNGGSRRYLEFERIRVLPYLMETILTDLNGSLGFPGILPCSYDGTAAANELTMFLTFY